MAEKLGITFGICTFNRKELLVKSLKSLGNVCGLERINIRIYDDCSTEYDEGFLRKIFPYADSIKRASKNQGADMNTAAMYEDFLQSSDEWLFNADSDLLYSADIIDRILELKDASGGFMTMFNCINHRTIGTEKEFVIKDSVGAAGCLLSRNVVELILNQIQNRGFGFDVKYSRLLREHGFKLYATRHSYVQHIGVEGFNSRDINFDYGENFNVKDGLNAEIIEETFETYIRRIAQYRLRSSWKIYYFIISLPRRLRRLMKIAKERLL